MLKMLHDDSERFNHFPIPNIPYLYLRNPFSCCFSPDWTSNQFPVHIIKGKWKFLCANDWMPLPVTTLVASINSLGQAIPTCHQAIITTMGGLVYQARPSYAAAIMRFPIHAGEEGLAQVTFTCNWIWSDQSDCTTRNAGSLNIYSFCGFTRTESLLRLVARTAELER